MQTTGSVRLQLQQRRTVDAELDPPEWPSEWLPFLCVDAHAVVRSVSVVGSGLATASTNTADLWFAQWCPRCYRMLSETSSLQRPPEAVYRSLRNLALGSASPDVLRVWINDPEHYTLLFKATETASNTSPVVQIGAVAHTAYAAPIGGHPNQRVVSQV